MRGILQLFISANLSFLRNDCQSTLSSRSWINRRGRAHGVELILYVHHLYKIQCRRDDSVQFPCWWPHSCLAARAGLLDRPPSPAEWEKGCYYISTFEIRRKTPQDKDSCWHGRFKTSESAVECEHRIRQPPAGVPVAVPAWVGQPVWAQSEAGSERKREAEKAQGLQSNKQDFICVHSSPWWLIGRSAVIPQRMAVLKDIWPQIWKTLLM